MAEWGLLLRDSGFRGDASHEQVLALARGAARPGDVVSLSPASASFDAYPNFEARGRHFKQIVNAL